jgi:uncharacterized protein involved in exopolysaccharide biosynthesis
MNIHGDGTEIRVHRARPLPNAPESRRDGLLRTLRRRRGWIIAATMLALAAAVAYEVLTVPRYTAAVRILYDPASQHADDARSSEAAIAAVESQPYVLSARTVLGKVAAQENLATHPLFGQRPSGLRVRLLQPIGLAQEPREPADKALRLLERRVTAVRIDQSFILELAVTTEDAALSARLANAIAQTYLDEEAGKRAEAGRRVGTEMASRLEEARTRLRDVETQIERLKAEQKLANSPQDEQQLRELSAQLVAARTHTGELRDRLDQLRAAERRRVEPDTLPESLQSKQLAVLLASLGDARRQATDQQARLGPRHPAVAAAEGQLRETRQQVQDEVARIARTTAAELERAQSQEIAIERSVEKLKAETFAAGEAAARLRELERDAATSRAVYEGLMLRARDVDAAPGARASATRIIAPAVVPLSPSSPPAFAVIAASLLLGLGLGTGLALLAERMDDRLRDIDRFVAVSGAPVLAVVPDGRRLSARRFGSLAMNRARAQGSGRGLGVAYPSAERLDALYRLASALGIAAMGPEAQTIVFTSAEPTDERPACVIDLGLAVAAGGRQVVIVDADTRRRQLSRLIRAGHTGVVEVLEEHAKIRDVVLTDHLTGLQVLPLSRATASRLARFSADRIRAAVADDADEPVDLLVDASDPHDQVIAPSLLAMADATVMIVRNGITRARTLREAMSALRHAGVRVTGLVIVV